MPLIIMRLHCCICPLYGVKCDPFLMLAHALGSVKYEDEGEGEVPFSRQIQPLAQHLNDKVHDLSTSLMSEAQEAKDMNFDLEAFIKRVDPDL